MRTCLLRCSSTANRQPTENRGRAHAQAYLPHHTVRRMQHVGRTIVSCGLSRSLKNEGRQTTKDDRLSHCFSPLCTKLGIVKYSIALAALACAAAGAAVLPPYDLECEARRNPVGIDAQIGRA